MKSTNRKKMKTMLFCGIAIPVIIIVGIFIFFIIWLNEEYPGYSGDATELYSVAVYSLLGADGYFVHETFEDPQIKVLDEDEHGRVMFAYNEGSKVSTLSLLIMQKKDAQYAYYYPDYNFISTGGAYDYLFLSLFEDEVINSFTEKQIQELKELNDWGQSIDEEKCIKVQIVRKKNKPDVKILEKDFEVLFKKIARAKGYKGTDAIFRQAIYCTSDDYSRTLYYAHGVGRDSAGVGVSKSSDYIYFNVALIFNADGTYNEETSVMELTDLYGYQTALKAFKKQNDWNQALT